MDIEPGKYGPLTVLKSAAGYYIGRMYHDPAGFMDNGSRESHYFPTQSAAEKALDGGWEYRHADENDLMYDENQELEKPECYL